MSEEKKSNETGVRYLAKDFTVSNDTYKTGLNNNDLIIGPSGAGKTGGYVIPNMLELVNSNSSMIVADTKNKLFNDHKDTLRANGFKVYTIDFVNPENTTVSYNPLDYIRKDKDGKYKEQDILTVSNALVKDDFHDPFWSDSAKNVVACLISFVLEAFPDNNPNLCKVFDMYNLMTSKPVDEHSNVGIPFLERWSVGHKDSFAVNRYRLFKKVYHVHVTWNCITQFVTNALAPFQFKEARKLFAKELSEGENGSNEEFNGDFRISDLGREKIVLFLNISDSDRTLDGIVNLFYTQALQALISEADSNAENDNRLKVPVRMILDDFAANARIPDFDKTISIIRSRAISVSIILQSLTQLSSMYYQGADKTIINNCDHIIYLGGSDLETAQYVSYRANLSIQTILNLQKDKVWILERGAKGMLRDKFPPYTAKLPKKNTTEIPQQDKE